MDRWGFLVVTAATAAAIVLFKLWMQYGFRTRIQPRAQFVVAATVWIGGAISGIAGLVVASNVPLHRGGKEWLECIAVFIIGTAWILDGNMIVYAIKPGLYRRRIF